MPARYHAIGRHTVTNPDNELTRQVVKLLDRIDRALAELAAIRNTLDVLILQTQLQASRDDPPV